MGTRAVWIKRGLITTAVIFVIALGLIRHAAVGQAPQNLDTLCAAVPGDAQILVAFDVRDRWTMGQILEQVEELARQRPELKAGLDEITRGSKMTLRELVGWAAPGGFV